MFRATVIALISTGLSAVAFAQSSTTTAPAEGTVSTTISAPSPFFGKVQPIAGIKSYNDAGRPQELNTPGGRQLKSKNEFFAGAKNADGFGLYGMAVETLHNVSANAPGTPLSKQRFTNTNPGDASASLMHPIYKDDYLSINGMFREYFPVSNRSQTKGIYQQAYYLNLTYKLSGGYDFFNQIVPRYFSAMKYSPEDGVFYVEDWTSISKKYESWLKVGFGQHTQVETHNDIPVGRTIEVYPYADFMISNTIYAGPRVYFPVFVQNSVYDAPTAVSANNIQAELYLQATL